MTLYFYPLEERDNESIYEDTPPIQQEESERQIPNVPPQSSLVAEPPKFLTR